MSCRGAPSVPPFVAMYVVITFIFSKYMAQYTYMDKDMSLTVCAFFEVNTLHRTLSPCTKCINNITVLITPS
jgi:hypothetical protein